MALSETSHAAAEDRRDVEAAALGIPQSAIPLSDGLRGLAALTAAWLLVLIVEPPVLVGAWLVLLATAAPMLAAELRRAPGTTKRTPDRASPLLWLAGFALAAAPLLLVHLQGMGLRFWAIAWAVAAPAFILRLVFEARRNGALAAGLPLALGEALRHFDGAAVRALAPAARLWTLKAFFIPLYGLSLYGLLQLALALDLGTMPGWLVLAVLFAYTIDLTFGLSGYVFASNDLAPTMRSTQPMLLGWIVCIACYGPVIVHWPDFEAVVRQEIAWPRSLSAAPVAIAGAIAMLCLLALYVSATVCFGLRFSNLSNRGVVTTGPYRLMKHPAYFAHAANAWILCLVLMPAAGIEMGISQWLVPIAFTILYGLRAITEERHMSEEPAYRAYAAWIARNGIVARLRRLVGL